MPPLTDVQTRSYDRFLQLDVPPEKRTPTGLEGVLREIFPIESYDKKDGGTGTNLKGRVSSLEFAGGKREDGEKSEPRKAAPPEQPKPRQQAKGGAFDTMDDDIPFDNPYRGIRAYVV